MHKQALRQQIRQIKRQFSPQQLEGLSLPVLDRLRPLLRNAAVVMAYYSLPDEVCTRQLLDELVDDGKMVLLPKVLDDETMELHRYQSSADLREGAFHIMEPVGAPFTEFLQIDVALIPGMAFDAQGHRLGRGKGYYDRLLTSVDCKTLGVCFDFQKVREVPVGEHDMPVDEVI
jgi:5-formyltetrahydrofolate cyclo-ligase